MGLQESNKENSGERDLVVEIQLQMPDHGERHANNEKVAEEGQETI